MRVVAQKPWAWTFFQDDAGTYVLSSLVGTVAQYRLEISLSAGEVRNYERFGLEAIDTLAQDVAANPATYKLRTMDGFLSQAAARDAIDRWRTNSKQVR